MTVKMSPLLSNEAIKGNFSMEGGRNNQGSYRAGLTVIHFITIERY